MHNSRDGSYVAVESRRNRKARTYRWRAVAWGRVLRGRCGHYLRLDEAAVLRQLDRGHEVVYLYAA
jgi:hypothetical protein